MTHYRRFLNNKKGALALPTVMTIMIIITIISATLIIFNKKAVYSTKREESKEKALYIAESGINNYLFNLNKDPDYFTKSRHKAQDNWLEFGDGEYKLDVKTLDNAVGVEITSNARTPIKNNGKIIYQNRTIKATIQKRSFLKYLYLTNYETVEGTRSKIWFISGDVIRGPVHSNDYINISGSPVFKAMVTTNRSFYPSVGSAIFEQGYQEKVQPLELPSTNNELKKWANDEGYYYYGKTTINLNSNGTIDVDNNSAESTAPSGSALPLPTNGVIYVGGSQTLSKYNQKSGNIFIEGTLKGKLTITSKNNIYITGDILYNNKDEDMLGLIAEGFLYINHYDEYGRDVAQKNITIQSALFSLNHSFTFEEYRDTPSKGTITVLGSIGQKYRGPVGTFWRGSIYSGYSKDYGYDQRMQYEEPPHFIEPLNSGFYISSWKEM